MYGKDFHQWREAQQIIAQIEAEEPEVREMVQQRYRTLESPLSALQYRGAHSPEAALMRQLAAQSANAQYVALAGRYQSPLNGIFGFFGR